ncbi:Mediator of RNA polymerase II transcription subunit 7 [Golovinomyces cichoracearum]|uniref:Mediator of RNA polymerase II transcription subunit 7 n=1 Tax=Golovinomyces cichoracearum TaxID=62708 RepID=A0A420J631_9PEZI|nr:Mediator of RNA polymerase II transcription subunit 7 [Golovinomyces cichoracearum]
MEEPQQSHIIAAAFPDPPPFYQYFNSTNLQKLNSLRASRTESKDASNASNPLPVQLPDLPIGLRYLQPPEPPSPADGNFRCFGDVYYVKEELPSLQDMNVEQVYTPPSTPSGSQTPSQSAAPHNDRALVLKRLAKSLLLNFLELVGVMATNSSHWSEKVQDIRTLSINFHHLLNEYRPHQARETLILMMREQLETRKTEIRGIKECQERVELILEDLGMIEATEEPSRSIENETDIVKDIWKELEKEFE